MLSDVEVCSFYIFWGFRDPNRNTSFIIYCIMSNMTKGLKRLLNEIAKRGSYGFFSLKFLSFEFKSENRKHLWPAPRGGPALGAGGLASIKH